MSVNVDEYHTGFGSIHGPYRLGKSIVPRYYIDVRSHFSIQEDPRGLELPDLAAARAEALKVAERLLRSWAGLSPSFGGDILIEVVGEDLRPVLVIPCLDVERAAAPRPDPSP